MKNKIYLHAVVSILVLLVMLGCDLSGVPMSVTATPASISGGGNNGGGNSSGGTGGNNPPGSALTSTTTPTPTATPTETPTPTPTPHTEYGPYLVKQTLHMKDETITGVVCDLTKPFVVNVQTKPITFDWLFVPVDDRKGAYSDSYSFPSLGETHDAKGKYTISGPQPDGMLVLALSGQDHVVFKGFDGNMPFRYSFGLVPLNQTNCPPGH